MSERLANDCATVGLNFEVVTVAVSGGDVRELIGKAASCGFVMETGDTCPYQARIDAHPTLKANASRYNQAGRPLEVLCPSQAIQNGEIDDLFDAIDKLGPDSND